MRIQKIRGQKRKWKEIDRWVSDNTQLDIDHLKRQQRSYVKIRVHPWSGYSLLKSSIPEPTGATRTRMLNGLIEIYHQWKKSLDELKEPYYLSIWLYEPRFSQSQVVCAIGSCLDFYKNTFYKPSESKQLHAGYFGPLAPELKNFQWEYRLDEDHHNEADIGIPEDYNTMAEYEDTKKLTRKKHRTTNYTDATGMNKELSSFKKGVVWIGHH